jgi:hypothetical protein
MDQNKKLIAIGAVFIAVVAFAFGRYTTPEKVKVETVTKTVEVEKKTHDATTQIDQNRNRKREIETVELVRPDGSKETRTKTVETTETNRDRTTTVSDREKSTTTRDEETRKEVSKASGSTVVSVLGGAKLDDWVSGKRYGLAVTRNVIGPVTIGVWGLNDTTCGLSVGLSF